MAIKKRSCNCNNNLGELKILYKELVETRTDIKPEEEASATDLIDELNKLKQTRPAIRKPA